MTRSQSYKFHIKATWYHINICLAIIAMLSCVLIFFLGTIHHYQNVLQCECFSCLADRATQQEDYTYNRYLPVISLFCMLLILLPLYIFNHKQKKKETPTKRTNH